MQPSKECQLRIIEIFEGSDTPLDGVSWKCLARARDLAHEAVSAMDLIQSEKSGRWRKYER